MDLKLPDSKGISFLTTQSSEDCAVRVFSGGVESSTEHKPLSASYKALLIEPLGFRDIFVRHHSPPPLKDWG